MSAVSRENDPDQPTGESWYPVDVVDVRSKDGDLGDASRMKREPSRMDCTTCESRASGIFCGLDRADLEAMERHRRARHYPKGQILFYEGDRAAGIYCVKSGRVKVYQVDDDAKPFILGVAGPADVLGIESVFAADGHDVFAYRAEMLEDGTVCFIDRAFFIEIVRKDFRLAERVIRVLSHDLREANESRTDLAYRSVRERIARTLLLLARSHGCPAPNGTRIDLKLSREEIAGIVGAATETVIRGLHALSDRGVIELGDPIGRSIVILDEEALLRIAHRPPDSMQDRGIG